MKDLTVEQQKKITDFLDEYKALCLKHSMIVSSCGCCNSPWVERSNRIDEIAKHVEHLKKEALE